MIYILEKYLSFYIILFKLILIIPFYDICYLHIICIDSLAFIFKNLFCLLDPEMQETFECFSGKHLVNFSISLLSFLILEVHLKISDYYYVYIKYFN